MADIITRLKFDTDEFHNRARRMTTEINDISHKMEVAGNTLVHTNEKNLKLAQSFGTVQTASTTLRGKISELQESFVAWSHHYNMLTAQQKSDPYGKAIVQQLDILKQRIRETKSELSGIEGQLGGLGGRSFGQQFMNQLIPGFSMGLGAMAAMEAVKALRAFKDVAVDTVKVNMDFEQSNANLAAILGEKTIVAVSKLTENAKMLGATTVYTAGEISQLQTVLARRGLNEQQILQMTHGISNLAVATGTDLAQSAELAASTMQSFGMKAGEMERIVSVLGVSTTKSALTTESLGTSLQYVAPAARAAGFSLEDTVAILGTLVNNGINASTAGTSLRQIMLSMGTESGKLAKALGGPIKSFDELVEALKRLKNDGADSLESVSKAVRVTALPAFLALVNSADGLDSLRESITGVEGELQQMADTQINTLKGSTILLSSAWDGLKLSFSESNGIIKETVDLLTQLITKVTNARKLAQGGEGAIGVFAKGVDQDEYNRRVGIYGDWKYDDVKSTEMTLTQDVRTALAGMEELQKRYDKLNANYKGGNDTFYGKQMAALDEEASQYGVKSLNALVKKIAEYRDIVATSDAIINHFDTSTQSMSGVAGDETSGSDIIEELKKQNHKKTPAEIAQERVANAWGAYETAISKATIDKEGGLLNEEQYQRKLLSATESLYGAYMDAYQTYKDPRYKENIDTLASEQLALAKSISEVRAEREIEKNDLKKANDENKALVKADNSLYRQINSSVGRTAWDRIAQSGDEGKALKGRFAAMRVQLDGGVEIPNDVWEKFVDDLNEKLAELKLAPIKLDLETNSVTKMADTVKDVATQWGYVAQAVSSVGSALQTVGEMTEDPSAKIAGIVATAIASTALGFAQATTADSKFGTLAWIAAAAAGLANMTAMVASIKSITAEYHADGGFVGSGPRGTDTVNTWLTPGELVLNRAQQNNLAGQLAGSANKPYNIVVTGKISGRDIRLAADADNRSRGGSRGVYANVR